MLKIRSKGEPSKKPSVAPGVLKKVILVNLRSNPYSEITIFLTVRAASAGLEKKVLFLWVKVFSVW